MKTIRVCLCVLAAGLAPGEARAVPESHGDRLPFVDLAMHAGDEAREDIEEADWIGDPQPPQVPRRLHPIGGLAGLIGAALGGVFVIRLRKRPNRTAGKEPRY